MLRNLFAGFADPVRRPRYLIWTATALVVFVAFMVAAFIGTSNYWFCAEVCHKVQDDAIIAHSRSPHAAIGCMSCHEPVNANPVVFTFAKMKALGELYLTVTDTFELPLNAESHLAMDEHHMGSEQCTQCHTTNRVITASAGIIINHEVHEENDVHCTVCHNRTAHPEDFELTGVSPNGEPSRKHEDWMLMEGCFRCHVQEGEEPELGKTAPGACEACHPADFNLVPASHETTSFYTKGGESSGHWQLAAERPDYCVMCHKTETFCTSCHGVEMPHPEGFAEGHGDLGKSKPTVCANCHAKGELAASPTSTDFCNSCHHPMGDQNKPWKPQHSTIARQGGVEGCFECHKPTYCAECHVRSTRQ